MGKRGTVAVGSPQRPNKEAPSIIAPMHTVSGNLDCDGDIHIDGTVVGDVRCFHLTVGENGCVNGNISASFVQVFGAVEGSIQAKEALISKQSQVSGDVIHEKLVVEKGAVVYGFFRSVKKADVSGRVDIRNQIGEPARQQQNGSRRRATLQEAAAEAALPMTKARLTAKPLH
jgi:cytoskeletal protein CcmA (bactofilin family)